MGGFRNLLMDGLLLAFGIVVGLIIAEEFVPPDAPKKNPPAVSKQPAPPAGYAAPYELGRIDQTYIERVLANVDFAERVHLLADEKLFRNFVTQEARNRSIKAAAIANGIDTNVDVDFLMQRAADNILRQSYMSVLMSEQLPEDFPSQEQIESFYNKNREQFITGDRVQVWQIFLPVATADEATVVERQARNLLMKIRSGQLSFADAVVNYSAHTASRQSDGYMGVVQVSRIKPAIAEALANIDEDELTRVRNDDGWHILKKGRTLPGRQESLADVQNEIQRLLADEARRVFSQAIAVEATKQYPYQPSDSRIEQWRQSINTALAEQRKQAANEQKSSD